MGLFAFIFKEKTTKRKIKREIHINKQFSVDNDSSNNMYKTLSDDEYVSFSDLRAAGKTNSKLYTYRGLFVAIAGNEFFTVIAWDVGYEPMILYHRYLTNEWGCTLDNAYGLTDLIQEYSYKGNSFCLVYDSDDDTIMFKSRVENEKIPKWFFETVLRLKNIDVTEFKG